MTTCLWSMAAFWLAMLLLMGYLAYTVPPPCRTTTTTASGRTAVL